MNTHYKFEDKVCITSYMVDSKLQLLPHYLLSIFQEIASNDCYENKISGLHLRKYNCFWALVKMRAKIFRMPSWPEKVVVKTWGKPYQFVIQPRDFQIFDTDGNLLIVATSTWVLLDEHAKPQKLNRFQEISYCLNDENVMEDGIPKIAQAATYASLDFHPILHSDLDLNEHVNNTKYVMWAMDSLSHDFHLTHQLKEISVHYISQAYIGDQYAIATQHLDNNSMVQSIMTKKDNHEVCRIQTVWE